MHITPEMCRAAYEYLRTTPPFKRWKLPPSDNIEWMVSNAKNYMGQTEHFRDDTKFRISMSQRRMATSQALIETMAHEMCHMRQRQLRAYKPAYGHGKDFWKLAEQVCKTHGYNKDYF